MKSYQLCLLAALFITSSAAPGATVTLPEGVISTGELIIPEGLTLAGAGVGKTILDAEGQSFGLRLSYLYEASL